MSKTIKKRHACSEYKKNHPESSNPKVSVIILVNDAEDYLQDCLTSIIHQSFGSIEIILIDVGSTDDSFSICKEYAQKDERIRVYFYDTSCAGDARNYALELAKGEYVLFLAASDSFELNMVEKLYEKAQITGADIIFCDFGICKDDVEQAANQNLRINRRYIPQQPFSAETLPAYIFNIIPNIIRIQLYKRKFLKRLGLQDLSNDIFLNLITFSTASRIAYLDKVLVHVRSFETKFDKSNELRFKDVFTTFKEMAVFLQQNNKYEKLKRSFLCTALSEIMSFRFTKEPVLSLWKDFFKNEVLPWFKFNQYPENWYASKSYDAMKEVLNDRAPIGLLPSFFCGKPDKIVPIVMATNSHYVSCTGVTIESIIAHASNQFLYDIYILHTGLSTDDVLKLEALSQANVRCLCVDISNKLPDIKLPVWISHISKETYYRFALTDLFCGYDKILYLDSDLIVQEDIASLYQTNIDNFLLAGCWNPFPVTFNDYLESWGLDPSQYINAGVLLINLRLWREEYTAMYCWDLVKYDLEKLKYMDQDILNLVCKDRILLLDPKWNIQTCNLSKICYAGPLKMDNYLNNPGIIHYAGPAKPWNELWGEYQELWWRYARKSPFYEEIMVNKYKE